MSNNKSHFRERNKHTEAKLNIYEGYLGRYLSILAVTKGAGKRIFIYDLFCGPGTYNDGNDGSPLIAAKAIKAVSEKQEKWVREMGVEFHLLLNDKNAGHIGSVESIIMEHLPAACQLKVTTSDYAKRINEVIGGIPQMNDFDRAFLFIDPYGYKDIRKQHFIELLKSPKFEVLIFLPVSSMYRFASSNMEERAEEDQSIKRLLEFTEDFEHDYGFLRESDSIEGYIERLNESFRESIQREIKSHVFTCFFDLKNEKNSNHYALFHICTRELAKEKMLEVFWGLDTQNGRCFDAKEYERRKMLTLPDEAFRTLKRYEYELEARIMERLQQGETSSQEIRKITLESDCLLKHMKDVLKKLETEQQKIIVEATDGQTRKSGTFAAIDGKNRSFVVRLRDNSTSP